MRRMPKAALAGGLLSTWLLAPVPAQEPAAAAPPAPAAAEPAAPATEPAEPGEANRGSPMPPLVEQLAWRHLGPANPMGRMTDIEVPAARQNTWYVGTAGGGLWKTDNAGTSWTAVFDRWGSVSIGDVATAPSNPDIVWVGTGEENARNSVQWGNGVYKSLDGGASWAHVGLRETFQIGHIAIHPQNPDIVYVAALGRLWGDNDERGVYRTKDGGQTWERVLFLDARTGCIDVRLHPRDPDLVFACMYERRRDAFDGNDPAVRFGKHSGLYQSIDGGDNWRQLTTGLPASTWGRSGIDMMQSDPDTMFLVVETERSGWQRGDRKDRLASDPPDRDTPAAGAAAEEEGEQPQRQGRGGGRGGGGAAGNAAGARGQAILGVAQEGGDGTKEAPGAIVREVTADGPAAKAGLAAGDRITKVDEEAIATYGDLLEIVRDSAPDRKLVLTYVRGEETKTLEVTLGRRDDALAAAAGRPNGPYSGRLFGQEANKQRFQGELGHETGGVFRSDDRGKTWRRVNSLTERPFYYSVIRVDPRDSKRVYCVGTSLWASTDGGEKFGTIQRGIHVDFHGIWIDPDDSDHLLAVSDGGVNETFDAGATWQVHRGFCAAQYYDAVADNSVPYNVIGGLQDNGTWVVPSRTRAREGISADDCFTIYGGDGFGAQADPVEPWIVYATSQNGALGIVDLRTGQQTRLRRDRLPGGTSPTFNWDAPFVLSPHNRLTFYHAGSHLFRGERSSHLDHRNSRPGQGPIGGDGVRMRAISPRLGRTEQGTAVALAESPRVQGLLYVGTDDGALWRSGDGGGQWERIDGNLPIVAPRYISDIVPSHFADDRVYLTLDGHRSDDFGTYLFVSDDRGASWRGLERDLPTVEPCYAVMEDARNEDLLFLGTEQGAYASLDRGEHWHALTNGLPTVAVRDLFVQDRDSDLIAATHGRGVFVLDIEALRQMTAAVQKRDRHLFAVEPAWLWRLHSRGHQGHKQFLAKNPPYGVTFHVWQRQPGKAAPVLTVHDLAGEEIAKVEGKPIAGLQPIVWDARRSGNQLATPGTYTVRWQGDTKIDPRAFELRPDPITPAEDEPSTATAGSRE